MNLDQQHPVVAIMSPGDMGHAIGRELAAAGFDVASCLQGRSQRTRDLARQAGIRSVDNWNQLVKQADFIMSILVPAEAVHAAETIASAMRTERTAVHYIDCNAVAPQTVKSIGSIIQSAGGEFSDGSLIGLPPGREAQPTRLYLSGPSSAAATVLRAESIDVRRLGDELGQASALKMCYAGITKATFALYYAAAIVAERNGLWGAFAYELESSQTVVYENMRRHLPQLPVKAHRWVGEMQQIEKAFAAVQMTPDFHQAAADVFRMVSRSAFAQETPETVNLDRSLGETIAELARVV